MLEKIVKLKKYFSAEMITIFCAGTGVALIIPITALITAYSLVKNRENKEKVI